MEKKDEGELTAYRSSMVNTAITIGEVAQNLGMNEYLLFCLKVKLKI